MYVESVVPKEDLLIWNVKDGWEPLCSFLDKEMPDEPIPHDNKTGDVEWFRNHVYKHKMYVLGMKCFFEKFRVFCYQSGIRVLFATNRDKNTSIRFFLLTFFFILISYNEQ